MFNRRAIGTAAVSLLAIVKAQQPRQIPFNTSASAGPDGPWNFITLQVGSGPPSSVDFYPMLSDQSSLLVADAACPGGSSSQCLNPRPGYYDGGSSSAKSNSQSIVTTQTDLTIYDGGLSDQLSWLGNGHYWVDDIGGSAAATNVSFFVTTNITQRDGTKSFTPLSLLSLEQNAGHNQVKTTLGNATANTILGDYTASTQGASSSFSLHIGSAAFNQSGSLVLGGYDPTRLIEPPAVFSHLGSIRLNTVSFGASLGTSPWMNSSNVPSDFLGTPADVIVSPHDPHIYLSQNVCNLMAQYLPIEYDNDTNLYLWNTSSELYHDIVTSPSYLNFTFGDSLKTSIRVPFALLNLTMISPLKNKPTQYFPCSGRPNVWNLGRAFLQSAMLMQSYDTSSIAIAQAPGPFFKYPPQTPVQISTSKPAIQPYSNAPKWEDTWQGILTPLGSGPSGYLAPADPSSTSNPAAAGRTGLTSGAIAGIVIGALGGLALIIGAILISHHYRTKSTKEAKPSTNHSARYGAGAGSFISRPSLHQETLRCGRDTIRSDQGTLRSQIGSSRNHMPEDKQDYHYEQHMDPIQEKSRSPTAPGTPHSSFRPREIYITRSPRGSPRHGSMSSRTNLMAPTSVYNGRGGSVRGSRSGTIQEYPYSASANRSQTPLVEIDTGREVRRPVESVELDSRPHTAHRFELPDDSWGPPEMDAGDWDGPGGKF